MKKVLIIIWNMNIGGVQRQVADVIKNISNHYPLFRVELWIKNKSKNLYSDLEKLSNVRVVELGGASDTRQTLYDFLRMGWLFMRYRPDVVLTFHDYLSIVFAGYVSLLKLLKPVRFVIYEPNLTSDFMQHRKRSFKWYWLIQKIYPLADIILTTSKAAKLDLVKKFKLSTNKIKSIPTWSLAKISSVDADRDIDLLFVGRLEPQKQPEMCIDLHQKLHQMNMNVRTSIIGEGMLYNLLKQKIIDNNLEHSISLIGLMPPSAVVNVYRRAKIFVLPSIYEGMPLVALEAMAGGVPCIALNFNGAAEIIQDGETGYIVNSIEEMVQKTAELLQNKNLRLKMAWNGQRYFSESFGNRNLEMFTNELIGESEFF